MSAAVKCTNCSRVIRSSKVYYFKGKPFGKRCHEIISGVAQVSLRHSRTMNRGAGFAFGRSK